MKKKLLSLLLASVTALSVCGSLAACQPNDTWTEEEFSGTVTFMAPEEAQPAFKSLEAAFKQEHPAYKNMTIEWKNGGEGEALSAIEKDPSTAPHVFYLASDQLYQLAFQSKVLQYLPQHYVDIISERDVQTAVDFAKSSDGKVWAFPATNDNTFFLWYDKEKVTAEQAKTLDGLIEAAKAAETGGHILWNYGEGFYGGMFYLGDTGVVMEYADDVAYNNKQYTTNINSDLGQEITKVMYSYLAPENNGTGNDAIFVDSCAVSTILEGKAVAGIGGTWEKTTVMTALAALNGERAKNGLPELELEDKIGCTVLPTFKVGDKTYNLGSFAGPKYCGINSFRPEAEIKAALALAEFMNGEKGQLARYLAQGSGPSNKKAMEDERIKNDMILQAASAQMAADHSTVQGAQDAYWKISDLLVSPIAKGEATVNDSTVAVDEDKALELLAAFANTLVAKNKE